ncbi:RidA family protein [Mangrovicoccus sp. HB161399]|uniref:RidA family protein n=1 Tax=Mangrovicoccus sp. HB161399 TaxID=2720392 RepID=UPI0015545377|nr:RidA family protein [Mangrovicoccus sp. HB161399]
MNIAYIDPPGSVPAQGLYTSVGHLEGSAYRFVAGQLSVNAAGDIVGADDFDAQFDQVFGNLEGVIKGLGGSMASVVKFTTFVTSRDCIDPFMKKRAADFPKWYPSGIFPPNTLLIVQGLVKPEFMLEVEAVVAI